jgi:hypothetical protein
MADTVGPQLNVVEDNMRPASDNRQRANPHPTTPPPPKPD